MRPFLASVVVVSLMGCLESGTRVRGDVTVSAAVQQQFSRARPGEVFFITTLPGSNGTGEFNRSLALLCDPQAELVLPLDFFEFGVECPGTTHVTAWAEPIELADCRCAHASV